MNQQNLDLIRESIALACAQEAQTRELQTYLAALVPRLHKAISLPDNNPSEALLQFVMRYIEQVPDCLQALKEMMADADLLAYGQTFLTIAEDFFLKPPELIQQSSGLRTLIDQAYLAHRLIEEVNDRLLMLCGVPLTPMDMTLSNILVHDLLGEEYANQLDLAVHYAIEALFQTEHLAQHSDFAQFVQKHKNSGWGDRLDAWPCLAQDSAITLNFAENADPDAQVH